MKRGIKAIANLPGRRFEREWANRILWTKPIRCRAEYPFEIHVLTCSHDIAHILWALKSLYLAMGFLPSVTIHDDGSLDTELTTILENHFPDARILTDEFKLHDRKFRSWLAAHPCVSKWRWTVDHYLARKIIDFRFYCRKPYFIAIDSDILFFRCPNKILQMAMDGRPFISQDCQSAYCVPFQELKQNEILVPEKANAGLYGDQVTDGDISRIENILGKISEMPSFRQYWQHYWLDQTVTAALLYKNPQLSLLPSDEYSLATAPINKNTISHHFCGNEARPAFFRLGVRQLILNGILERLHIAPEAGLKLAVDRIKG